MDTNYLPDTAEGKLVHLMEECSEVIQATAKTLRFGPTGTWKGESNTARLESELADLEHSMVAVKSIIDEFNNSKAKMGFM